MNKPILILGIVTLLLISGCSSSFENCRLRCRNVFDNDFKYETKCDTRNFVEMLNNTEPIYEDCQKINYDELNKFCFNECKPK